VRQAAAGLGLAHPERLAFSDHDGGGDRLSLTTASPIAALVAVMLFGLGLSAILVGLGAAAALLGTAALSWARGAGRLVEAAAPRRRRCRVLLAHHRRSSGPSVERAWRERILEHCPARRGPHELSATTAGE
jgi:hypothetical protein